MIEIRHNLSKAELEKAKVELRAAFERAGLLFCEEMFRFRREVESAASGFAKFGEVMVVRASDMPALEEMPELKKTAWERRNPNAPWYRRFHSNRRRA